MDQLHGVVAKCSAVDCSTPPPESSSLLCDGHLASLFAALSAVPGLETELDVTRARQDRLQAPTDGGRSAERPLPFSWSGAEQGWTFANTLATWAGELARALDLPLDEYGHPAALAWEQVPAAKRHARAHVVAVPGRIEEREVVEVDEDTGKVRRRKVSTIIPPRFHDDPAAIVPPAGLAAAAATWLARHIADFVKLPDIGQAADEITYVVSRTRYVIDRAPTRWYVGACDECGTAMYSHPGGNGKWRDPATGEEVAVVLCPDPECVREVEPASCPIHDEVGEWCSTNPTNPCPVRPAVVERTWYDVHARRAWLLSAAEDYWAGAAEAVALVKSLTGVQLNINTLRTAARRGEPPEVATDDTHPGKKLRYRLGDVLSLARRMALRHAG